MNIPDYGKSVEQVGLWIAAANKLEIAKTMFLEPLLPEKPDTLATLFETGGTWKTENDQMVFSLLLVTRAPLLAKSRDLAIGGLMAAVNGWLRSPKAERGIITNMRINRLPQLQPRDEGKRVILESLLEMTINAPFDLGVDNEQA